MEFVRFTIPKQNYVISIKICHLTYNFGYFLLENFQSEYANLFKFKVLGFSTLFLKILRSSYKTI